MNNKETLVTLSVKCIFHGGDNTGSLKFSVEGFPEFELEECDMKQLARESISLLNTYLDDKQK